MPNLFMHALQYNSFQYIINSENIEINFFLCNKRSKLVGGTVDAAIPLSMLFRGLPKSISY